MVKSNPHISPIELLEILETFSYTRQKGEFHGQSMMQGDAEPKCLEEFLARTTLLCDRIEALSTLVAGHHIDPWIAPSDTVFCGPLFAKVLEVAAIAPLRGQSSAPRFDPQEFIAMLVSFNCSVTSTC